MPSTLTGTLTFSFTVGPGEFLLVSFTVGPDEFSVAMVAKPKRAPLPKKIIQKRCRKKATRSKVKAKDTRVHDDHHREEVLALLQAWKDNVPVSDINRREIRMPSTASLKHSKRHLDARSGCPRLPNSETLVPVWRTDSADAKAVLHTGTNASAFCTS